MERRYTQAVLETRSADDGARTIVGHASVFDTPYPIWDFDEQVARGAFTKTRNEADVAALWNHDPNVVLGRNKSGTLRLIEDDDGLRYEVDLPDTQAARDLYTLIQRGDVYQSSFSFEIIKEDWDYGDEGNERSRPLRTIREVRLYDVSPVTYPASPSTDVDVARAVRSLSKAIGVTDETCKTVSDVIAAARTTEEPEPEPDTHSDATPEPVISHPFIVKGLNG